MPSKKLCQCLVNSLALTNCPSHLIWIFHFCKADSNGSSQIMSETAAHLGIAGLFVSRRLPVWQGFVRAKNGIRGFSTLTPSFLLHLLSYATRKKAVQLSQSGGAWCYGWNNANLTLKEQWSRSRPFGTAVEVRTSEPWSWLVALALGSCFLLILPLEGSGDDSPRETPRLNIWLL